jgi:hypothetical protein
LCPIGHKIPKNENQVRPLAGLSPELQLEIWQEVLESSPNGMPTGAAVQRLVDERFLWLGSGRTPKDNASEVEKLRSDNQSLGEQIREQDRERDRRAAVVAFNSTRKRKINGNAT